MDMNGNRQLPDIIPPGTKLRRVAYPQDWAPLGYETTVRVDGNITHKDGLIYPIIRMKYYKDLTEEMWRII